KQIDEDISVESDTYVSSYEPQTAEAQRLVSYVINDLQEFEVENVRLRDFTVKFQQGDQIVDAPLIAIDTQQLFEGMDEAARGYELDHIINNLISGSSAIATTGIAATYVLWIVRGSYLVAMLSSSIPTWAMIDPLPILNSGFGADSSDSLLDMVDKKAPVV
ncbi:MAG: hypothetical protein AAF497_17495, partial [Planctomycetota bacterium]